jgi:molybdate transport system substrate-binding protein
MMAIPSMHQALLPSPQRWRLACGLGLVLSLPACALRPSPATAPTPPTVAAVNVYAAGSLRDAFTEIARDHETRTGQTIALTFGPSGLLRERIEKGEGAQVFASADTNHPQRLAAGGGWAAQTVFTRNTLCALAQPTLALNTGNLLATLLRPDVKLGMSTPKADPSGDYALALFQKAEAINPGSQAQLTGKALQLTGGPNSPAPPAGRNLYAWVMQQGQADVFLTYCTNAVAARQQQPALQMVQVPAALQVGAAYGLTVRQGTAAPASAFAAALLAAPAQTILARHGFAAP